MSAILSQKDYQACEKQTRLDRLNNLHSRVKKQTPVVVSLVSVQENQRSKPEFDNFVLTMLWIDKQLEKRVNLFPLQLQQLQEALPDKKLRPILKMINTVISTSQKQVKSDDTQWKQQAIYMLELAQRTWAGRICIKQYNQLVYEGTHKAITQAIVNILQKYEISYDGIRGLVLRYLMDISN